MTALTVQILTGLLLAACSALLAYATATLKQVQNRLSQTETKLSTHCENFALHNV